MRVCDKCRARAYGDFEVETYDLCINCYKAFTVIFDKWLKEAEKDG
jgi:hypothetical protein